MGPRVATLLLELMQDSGAQLAAGDAGSGV